MRLAGLNKNDTVNGTGITVSLFVQGCPHHCEGCFNEESWDFNGGIEVPNNIEEIVYNAIIANGIHRNFSVLGGEPLCQENIEFTAHIIHFVRQSFSDIKIFVWTGYTLEDLKNDQQKKSYVRTILSDINTLIDGPFILSQRDITLPLRGSSNQRVLNKGIDF